MTDQPNSTHQLLSHLKQLRDELAVQVNLGKLEARDEWEKLEGELEEFENRCRPAKEAAGETAEGVGSALQLAGEELKAGYEKLRRLL